jgi:hypothetical protein
MAAPQRDGVFEVTLADAESDGSSAADAAPRCAVVLFGWLGCTPRLLRRYASACLATGAARCVYATTAPTAAVFASPSALRRLAADALALLARRHAPGTPCVLGYFSNGGAFVHRHLLRLLAEDAARPAEARLYASVHIAATLFDSAPAYLTVASASRALTEAIRSAAARKAAYSLLRCVMPLFLLLCYGWGAPERYWREMCADALPCPALYIYSEHDALTDAARLDALVAARRAVHARGAAAVRALRIGADEARSEHVAHLLRHPQRYADALKALLTAAAAARAAAR